MRGRESESLSMKSLVCRIIKAASLLIFFGSSFNTTSAFVVCPPVGQPSSPSLKKTSTTAVMGIKGFRSWLESQFPGSIVDMPIEQASEQFDHVLIDMNQLLHIVLRKSRSDGHGLTLLMKELDECLRLASPRKSLVLAMDGPPSAAKLATQRKRRFSTVVKTDQKIKQIDKLLANPSKSKRHKPKLLARKKRRAAAETRTLCITPATEFMFSAEQALLYWAWQRLSSRSGNCLTVNNVKVFISPSTVAGEGEVKLLEWIYNKPSRKGESIAIIGGDSDLVLEGLVVPPASTHNVFVLLPEGSRRYLSVSLWEITRQLHRLLPHVKTENITRARTDLALLLIMNGNDYLPKLRGSSGFNKLFHTYLRIQRTWKQDGKHDDAFLVDPDMLEFNLDFCIDFWSRMAAIAPTTLWYSGRKGATNTDTNGSSSLHQLNNLVDAGYLPSPIHFRVIRDEDNSTDDVDDESVTGEQDYEDENDDDEDGELDELEEDISEEEVEEDQVLVRLTVGEPGTEDFSAYELWLPKEGFSRKSAKQKLSAMALSDLIGADSDEEGSDEEEGISAQGYDWEVKSAVEGKADAYLYGLLWNLQTYQDGICGDYGFNYGKRLSPTAKELVEFLTNAQKEERKVGLRELSPGPFTPPVSAGVSCLAALPSTVKHLVPEPYRSLDDDLVESMYGACMDKADNAFDIKRFETLCDEQIESLNATRGDALSNDQPGEHNGRRIMMGDHHWTVISKVPKPLKSPFDPPLPFSSRLSKLRPNNYIRVGRILTRAKPCPRAVWTGHETTNLHKEGFVNKNATEVIHSDPGEFLQKYQSIKTVDYITAYGQLKPQKQQGLKKGKRKKEVPGADQHDSDAAQSGSIDIEQRLRAFKLVMPPDVPLATTDGVTGMACLKQLQDAGLVGAMRWETKTPSHSDYASFDPKGHETIRLTIGKGNIVPAELTYLQDRQVKSTTRQTMKQHLASIAVQEIIGKSTKWSDLSFKEIRFLLNKRIEVVE